MHGIALRYFNPIGADPKMRSGIHVQNPIARARANWSIRRMGNLPEFRDHRHRLGHPRRHGHPRLHPRLGPGQAHVQAADRFRQRLRARRQPADNYLVINLGTGHGVTVRELVTAFEKVYGKTDQQKRERRAARAMWPAPTPTPTPPNACWAGKPNSPSSRASPMRSNGAR